LFVVNYFKNKHKLILILIIVSSFCLKLLLSDLHNPVYDDALKYYYYSVELFFHNKLPEESYPLHNLGWPVFLALIFKIIPRDNFDALLFQNIQRISSIIISCLIIPLIYLLCRKFFEIKYSLIGACIFAFEPRLIQNSVFGITDPLFMLFSISSFVLFFYKSKKLMLISFLFVALSSLTRIEGIMLYPLFFILILHRHNSKKTKIGVIIFVIAFTLILILIFNNINGVGIKFGDKIMIEVNQLNNFIIHGAKVYGNNMEFNSMVYNSLLHYFWSSFPMFLFFLPLGLYEVLKIKTLRLDFILILFFLSISGIIAYLDAYDTRYFFPVYPFFTLVSLFCIKKLFNR